MKTKKKIAAIATFIAVVALEMNTLPVEAKVATESTVTQEMCTSSYWNSRSANNGNILMDASLINDYNANALKTKECNMYDLTSMDGSFNATELKAAVANSILSEMPEKTIFVNSVPVDTALFYNAVSQLVLATGWDGVISPKYALAVSQTEIKSIPATDYIGYPA